MLLAGLTGLDVRSADYQGKYVEGTGDSQRLELIDKAFESMDVSAEMTSLSLFYKRDWDGLVESATAWPGWWIQNTYGPSYGMVPFQEEPYATWLKNAQAMWFRMMADGKSKDANGYLGPDVSLCDCTLIFRNGGRDLGFGHFCWSHSTGPINYGAIKMQQTYYRQGDAGHEGNDWGIGFTAAGLVMECERLLIIGAKCGGQDQDQAASITLGHWTHIAVVINKDSRSAVIYINGRAAYEMKELPLQTAY
jgi:hypothetical protein